MPRNGSSYIIGIDEVGRGPLAGPVVVAGVWGPAGFFRRCRLRKMRDSKRLTPAQREAWHQFLTQHPDVRWAVARVWPKTIDRINIARAADLAAYRVYRRLCESPKPSLGQDWPKLGLGQWTALLDGGLQLPPRVPHQAIIKGDEKIPAIAAASIIAKVTRDRLMLRLHRIYPQYRFDLHKGYGTRLHRQLIAEFKLSPVHRISFAKKFEM